LEISDQLRTLLIGVSMLNKIQLVLKGKKTYIIGALMFLTSVEKYLTGDTTASQFLTTVQGILGFNGLSVVTLRAAIAKLP
jgi:hypothetical protein